MSPTTLHPADHAPAQGHTDRQPLLSPVAYSEDAVPSLRLVRSSKKARWIAKLLFMTLVAAVLFLAFAPWQQSVTGSGNVIAFAPGERSQTIEAPIKGRIVRWGDGIEENARVTKGQMIVEISDLDEDYSQRLADQLANTENQAKAAKDQLQANERMLLASKAIISALEGQLRAYQNVKDETVASQEAYVQMAADKLQAEKHQLDEYNAAIPQLQAEFDRTKRLQQAGNISLQKLQEIERKLIEYQAKVKRAESYVDSAESELAAKERDRHAKIQKAQGDIEYAQASLTKARGDISKAESDVAKAQQELSKAEKEVLEARIKVSRQRDQVILAPFDGFILQITPNQGSQFLKEGDMICTIVPETKDRAVQLWLDGNDAPLVEPGRHVRLQFEGWPAIQFSGWPSVAVGTFGGKVISVDATDNGYGKFRVLIKPDPTDPPWPDVRFLRQGVRANGWVLLDRVPLWFEFWRRLNSFPPVVDLEKDEAKTEKKSKPPKLPKS
ncbi:MAG: HlyD family efflux transporter periplasmic adaptor subunit [Pirellulales bacterium]|nr:HlyD family efflux transporter periplasmic adaptor subunit [Pirellulales bacterium]